MLKAVDIIIMIVILAAVIAALRYLWNHRQDPCGGCQGCSAGGCAGCSKSSPSGSSSPAQNHKS